MTGGRRGGGEDKSAAVCLQNWRCRHTRKEESPIGSWKWQTLITKADYLQKWRRSKWECQTLIMVLKKLKNIKNALKWLPIVLIHAPIYKSKRNLCWGLWSLVENGLKMLKAPSGYIMVISWLFHGYIMVTSWSCQSWLYHGFILVTYIRVISWLYHWMFWFRRSH